MEQEPQDYIGEVTATRTTRRTFLAGLLIGGGVLAAPVIASFGVGGGTRRASAPQGSNETSTTEGSNETTTTTEGSNETTTTMGSNETTTTMASNTTTTTTAATTTTATTTAATTTTAGTTPTTKPTPTLSAPATSSPGATITASVTGFIPGETVTFVLHSDPVTLGSGTANSSGGLTQRLVIPASATQGTHQIEAVGSVTSSLVATIVLVSLVATR
jgi:hypothetical protein